MLPWNVASAPAYWAKEPMEMAQDQNIGVDGGKTRQGGGNDGQVQLGPAHVHIYRTSNAEETLIIFHQHIFHVV